MVGGRLGGIALSLALCGAPVVARAEGSIHAQVDATKVGVEDQLQLTITVEGSYDGDVALPPLQNLKRVGGPFVSSQLSIVNGAMSQTKSYTFVLQGMSPGKAEVGSVRVLIDGSPKTTPPIAVEVVDGSIRPKAAPQANPLDDPFEDDPFRSFFGRGRPRTLPKIEARAVASRARLHVGEPLLVTYYVYTQASISGVQPTEAPQYPGFWTEDLEEARGPVEGERATLDGVEYTRFPILKKLLFPTKAGALSIPAATFRLGLSRASLFEAGPTAIDRATKAISVTVDPLPVAQGFSGAVGDFRATATLDRDTVPLGEAATLRFTVEGTGNLKWVEGAPAVLVPGAKVYPPQTKSSLQATPEGVKGSRTWEFVVVPETSGTLEVPALPFTYFDPAAGALKHVDTRPLALQVAAPTAGGNASAPIAPAVALGAAPSRLALRSDLDLPRHALPVVGPRVVLLGLGLALVLQGAVSLGSLLSDRRRTASGGSAERRTVREALADLDRARGASLTKEQAAALIERTLHGIFGSVEEGSSGPRNEAILAVLRDVQFIRFAPQLGDYSETIGDLARRAADVVRRWA